LGKKLKEGRKREKHLKPVQPWGTLEAEEGKSERSTKRNQTQQHE